MAWTKRWTSGTARGVSRLTLAVGALLSLVGCASQEASGYAYQETRVPTVTAAPVTSDPAYIDQAYVYEETPEYNEAAVGYETISDGTQVEVVQYVHTYPEPVETFPRVYWSGRWYYNVHGDFVFWSPSYGGWCSYWGPPAPLVVVWNGYYPWATYTWGVGYYGPGFYWGGPSVYGFHAYGLSVSHHHHHHHAVWVNHGRRPVRGRPVHAGRPSSGAPHPGKAVEQGPPQRHPPARLAESGPPRRNAPAQQAQSQPPRRTAPAQQAQSQPPRRTAPARTITASSKPRRTGPPEPPGVRVIDAPGGGAPVRTHRAPGERLEASAPVRTRPNAPSRTVPDRQAKSLSPLAPENAPRRTWSSASNGQWGPNVAPAGSARPTRTYPSPAAERAPTRTAPSSGRTYEAPSRAAPSRTTPRQPRYVSPPPSSRPTYVSPRPSRVSPSPSRSAPTRVSPSRSAPPPRMSPPRSAPSRVAPTRSAPPSRTRPSASRSAPRRTSSAASFSRTAPRRAASPRTAPRRAVSPRAAPRRTASSRR